jgi:Ankyrin repeats (3 copies)
MTPLKSLPARPSEESLRKDAKKLARDIASSNAAAIARAHAQLPNAEMPLSQRDAQLVLAREYGYSGWQDLCAEVRRRLGKGLEWAAVEAESAIHRNDVERLRQLIAEYPALLSSRRWDGRVILHATTPYANDFSDPAREETFCRPQCAELLIDAGALIEPSVWEGVIGTGASGMLQVLQRKGVLPRTLPVLAALGDLEGVRRCFNEPGALRDEARSGAADAVTIVNEAFMNACRFKRKAVAAWLLDRCIALDPGLGAQIDRWEDRAAFVEYMFEHYIGVRPATPWRTFVMRQLLHAIDADDLPAFSRCMQSQPWLLEEGCVPLQVDLIERAVLMNRETLLTHLIAQDPAVLHSRTPPKSTAILFAFDEGNAHLLPQLTRIWPLPDDLPHAAGAGDFARVKRWFDEAGNPALGDPNRHHVASIYARGAAPPVQQVLDTAFAWACLNHRFEIAEFLLGHGANINTTWNTHEPASVLHLAAMNGDYELARFLIDRGIDMTIRDHRWGGTAEGWAYNVGKDPGMHEFLATAERERGNNRRVDESPPE